ncbi:MAG: DUF2911 domain-containing protein, partial [Saprospiraceae bacterium]|nr:DUF2911 domain-containing protein [Saprospiraceae bacterium]
KTNIINYLSDGMVGKHTRLTAMNFKPKVTTPADQFGEVRQFGNGDKTLILLPPLGMDWTVYQEFIDQNLTQYKMYAVTYPGFGGKAPYAFPEQRNFSNQIWLKNVEKALQNLIAQHQSRPIFLMGTASTSSPALQIALKSPDKIAGLILINFSPDPLMFSMKNPGQMATVAEKQEIMDKSFPTEILSPFPNVFRFGAAMGMMKDEDRANEMMLQASRNTTQQIYTQYANELQTDYFSDKLANLRVPILALCSRFDEESLNYGYDFPLMQWLRVQHTAPTIPLSIEIFENARTYLFTGETLPRMNALVHRFTQAPKNYKPDEMPLPAGKIVMASPGASLRQTIGGTTMQVDYFRPAVKGREVFGKLVPYGMIWRAGANKATEISFNGDVTINGQHLPKGVYSLFVLPEENQWTFHFDKAVGQWGSFFYDPSSVQLKVTVSPELGGNQEWLRYDIENFDGNTFDLVLAWADHKARLKIEEAYKNPAVPAKLEQAAWKEILTDDKDDGRSPASSDGKALQFYFDRSTDTLWFRLDLHNAVNLNMAAMNLLIDIDANQKTGTSWFGTNTKFTFERMVTMWIRREGAGYGGVVGIADAEGVNYFNWTNYGKDNVKYYLDDQNNAYYIGIKRSDVAPNLKRFNVIGAVGQYLTWNDDIGDKTFSTVEIDLNKKP